MKKPLSLSVKITAVMGCTLGRHELPHNNLDFVQCSLSVKKVTHLFSCFLFYCGKSHNIKHTVLTIYMVNKLSGTKDIHIVMQLSPSSVSQIFHLPELKLYAH